MSANGKVIGFRPKKFLGQNFLVDKNLQEKIVRACEIASQDTILEIGGGRGEITKLIAKETDKMAVLEIDSSLFPVLKDNLAGYPKIRILHRSILGFNIARFFKGDFKIKVIGNLPYNITTPIIVHLLKFRDKIGGIFITVQKEFAQRMVALPGTPDWSAFSCFLQFYVNPEILFFY
ncbi:MAG: rRNA adenine dimethyltransferase family protein [Candidatus Omnitrophota bacterium]